MVVDSCKLLRAPVNVTPIIHFILPLTVNFDIMLKLFYIFLRTLNRLAITTGLNNQSYGLTTSRDGVPLPGVPGSRPTSKMTSSFGRAGM